MKAIGMLLMLTFLAGATSFHRQDSHEVTSANGKHRLKVDADNGIHLVSLDGKGEVAWRFVHPVWRHSFHLAEDGRSAAVVHWPYCQADQLDEPAIVIYGLHGAKRILTYRELGGARPYKPGEEAGRPMGDFWRIWREKPVKQTGDKLQLALADGSTRILDLASASLTMHEAR